MHHLIGELPAEHRPELHHLTHGGQPIQARHQRFLQARRNNHLRERPRKDVLVPLPTQDAGAENSLGQFLDIERHAIGLADDVLHHVAWQRPVACERSDQCLDLRALEPVEGDRGNV